MMACPFTVVDSMCSMLSTVVVSIRSNGAVSRPSNSSGFMPENCHATAITGISMFGKISVGVRKIMMGLRTKMSTARTMKVYGRSRATRTIHITRTPPCKPWLAFLQPRTTSAASYAALVAGGPGDQSLEPEDNSRGRLGRVRGRPRVHCDQPKIRPFVHEATVFGAKGEVLAKVVVGAAPVDKRRFGLTLRPGNKSARITRRVKHESAGACESIGMEFENAARNGN